MTEAPNETTDTEAIAALYRWHLRRLEQIPEGSLKAEALDIRARSLQDVLRGMGRRDLTIPAI